MTSREDITQAYISMQTKLERLVGRIVKPSDIEDVLQEAYLRAFQSEREQDIKHPLKLR